MLSNYFNVYVRAYVHEFMTAESSSGWVYILNYSRSRSDGFGLILAPLLSPIHLLSFSLLLFFMGEHQSVWHQG